MATLRDIRSRIEGVKSIEKITSAMKMVSSAKVRRAQKQVESARPYFDKVEQILASVVSATDTTYENPLFAAKKNEDIENVLIFIIAGDKGLCGSFNSGLFRVINSYINNEFKAKYPNAEPQLILLGNKAIEYYSKKDHKILYSQHNVFQPLDYSTVLKITPFMTKQFLLGNIDRVELFYSKFINLMKQSPTLVHLLPIKLELEKDSESSILPDYIFEPDIKTVIDMLVKEYLNLGIWEPLLESNAAEQAARLLSMDKATQNAEDMIKELNLQFNNARQAAITTEMLEIVGGAEALKG